jgi:hypothetical protein
LFKTLVLGHQRRQLAQGGGLDFSRCSGRPVVPLSLLYLRRPRAFLSLRRQIIRVVRVIRVI